MNERRKASWNVSQAYALNNNTIEPTPIGVATPSPTPEEPAIVKVVGADATDTTWEALAPCQEQSVIPAKDAQIKELKATIAQLTQQVASLQSTVEELQGTEAAAWKQQVMEAQEAIVSLRVENNNLRLQLQSAARVTDYKYLQAEYDKLSEQIGAIKAILGWDDNTDRDSGWRGVGTHCD